MALGNDQIERYSRQIIVPGIGGRAQERMLASRVVLVGPLDRIADPLAYMVGAGVGTVSLLVTDNASQTSALKTRMRKLNPDVTISTTLNAADKIDLTFAIVADQGSLETLCGLPDRVVCRPAILARLDRPARVAVLPSPPPCMRCSEGELLASFGAHSPNPGFVAMAASVEALKFLTGYAPPTLPSIIRFDGYASVAMQATRAKSPGARCGCGSGR